MTYLVGYVSRYTGRVYLVSSEYFADDSPDIFIKALTDEATAFAIVWHITGREFD